MKVFMNLPVAPSDNVMVEHEGNLLRVYFDFKKEDVTDIEGNVVEDPVQFSCQSVDIRGEHGYGNVVGAIVNDKYSPDDVQAITANYELAKDEESAITEEKRSEYLEEYKEFQAYRAHAKEVASKVINL